MVPPHCCLHMWSLDLQIASNCDCCCYQEAMQSLHTPWLLKHSCRAACEVGQVSLVHLAALFHSIAFIHKSSPPTVLLVYNLLTCRECRRTTISDATEDVI